MSDLGAESSEQITENHRSKKYMTFALGEERFAIPLSQVKEVIGLTTITAVPNVPNYFKGIINLRGRIISTMDLRVKLGLEAQKTHTRRTSIIITEIEGIRLGAIVDDVLEVVSLFESQIERKLDLSNNPSREYLIGVAKIEDKPLTLLLDIGKVLNLNELLNVKKIGASFKAA